MSASQPRLQRGRPRFRRGRAERLSRLRRDRRFFFSLDSTCFDDRSIRLRDSRGKVDSPPPAVQTKTQWTSSRGWGRYVRTGCGSNSVVECQLPKLNVASSNLVSRSTLFLRFYWGFCLVFGTFRPLTRLRPFSPINAHYGTFWRVICQNCQRQPQTVNLPKTGF